VRLAIAVVALLASSASAQDNKRPFFEASAGADVPVASKYWNDNFFATFAFNAGGGVLFDDRARTIGVEGSLSWTPLHAANVTKAFDQEQDTELHRFRLAVGGRLGVHLNPKTFFYGRLTTGPDFVTGSVKDKWSHLSCGVDTLGLFVAPAVGIARTSNRGSFGLSVGLPLSFHNRKDPLCLDMEYAAVELQVLVTVGTPL
jgi:hypothetical protein